ncbi:type I-C CRISPR-associated protein Cas8c/Csd1 [Psychrobacter sp. T6-6]|uniref:type I-C CRISPR-associated protein Cas8c/Csd1 n=1 Tax=Psychrobacter sp. T6-6 TaxID=3457452 RepID=UPI003FD32039
MSWLQRLYQTYELASQNEEIQAQESSLMPYYHVNQNVQIIVTINDKGDFVNADISRDGNGKVKSSYFVIPATNDSATRSGQIPPPHPLSDKVQYLAGDYFEGYAVNPKRDFHQRYLELLSSWCNSNSAHPKAKAILKYVQKGTLVKDLLKAEVLIADPDDKSKLAYPKQASDYPDSILSSLNKNTTGVFDQGAAFIAWRVTATELGKQAEHGKSETWRDDSLFDSWQQFYATLDSTDGFCYITGKNSPLASKHPNRILRSATNAKLISANDLSSFTFLGRFTDDDKSIKAHGLQGANISAVVTEKAHAALSWLLSRQGREEAGQAVVAWAISGDETPQPTQEVNENEPFDVEENTDIAEGEVNPFAMKDDEDFDEIEDGSEDSKISETTVTEKPPSNLNYSNNLGQTFAKHLNNTMQGYRQKLDAHDQISIITLDAATPGRMAVTYYHEAIPNDYIEALECWYQQFSWYVTYKDTETNVRKLTIKAPIPKLIAQVAYGSRLSDALKKQVVSQVIPCIVEGEERQLPWQLVHLCFKRACNPINLEPWEWEQSISVTCGLYRGYTYRQTKRKIDMELDNNCTDRSYLFGRLLAIANHIENLAMSMAGEGRRPTNAFKYMQRFTHRPAEVWMMLRTQSLLPYQRRLISRVGPLNEGYNDLIADIETNLKSLEEFTSNQTLTPEFLIGYDLQARWLKKHTIKDGKWIIKPIKDKKTKESSETNETA